MYSVLLTKLEMENMGCHIMRSTCQSWAEGVWMHPQFININQYIFIWRTSRPVEIFVHYKFCDPCHPFLFLHVRNWISDRRDWLQGGLSLLNSKPLKLIVESVLSGFVPESYWKENVEYSGKTAVRNLYRKSETIHTSKLSTCTGYNLHSIEQCISDV